jgi:hypothetical protein
MSGSFIFNRFLLQSHDFAPWTVFSTGDDTPQADLNSPAHFSAIGSDVGAAPRLNSAHTSKTLQSNLMFSGGQTLRRLAVTPYGCNQGKL